jgi:DNA modification methylase
MIDIHIGNALTKLKELPEQSVHTCVTSPPYWAQRNYNDEAEQLGMETNSETYIANMVAVFREVKRVLKDDGTLWLNLGDTYGQQQGSGFNTNKAKGRTNRVKDMQTELGDVNVNFGLPIKNLAGIPWRVALALQADGWYLRQDIIWHKPNPMPESCTDRCTKAHEYIFLLSKQAKYYYDNEAIRESTLHPNAKANWSSKQRIERAKSFHKKPVGNEINGKKYSGQSFRNKRSVWTVTTKPFKEAHFATYPKDLIEPCILAGCPEGGTVLDPFAGSGTTGIVAAMFQRNAILIELNAEYVRIMEARMEQELGLFCEKTVVQR